MVKPVDPNRLVLADKVFYSSGSYSAYASPWCTMITSRLAIGSDMIDTIDLLPSSFPNDVRIVSKVPLADPNSYGCGVYGYNFVAYGNYDGGSPKITVTPRKSQLRSTGGR
ncbi:hypothetical protein SAMN05192583_1481 [Sphingomonas gellani]|uniref:Uncharacterized protein n=1 Tax=Sphingomonas gellani TaxID=1166340 RepID=A0A1H8C8P1_9SPHN|nr:hypothetical protein [Sphingomonas gellani]SEM90814.1 hypothetical protein SAMN05192583_1481 [Sphingomonas gellani]